MKKVLILGAGMVVKPMVDYLLENGFKITVASRTKSKADNMIKGRENGTSVAWTVDDVDTLDKMIADHDLTVSLLPYTFHVTVANLCIRHKKNMVTTSYVSAEMKALDAEAKEAGIIILNELGVDPGFDHMTAMRIIDNVHAKGGKIIDFYSLCGALAAPEHSDNPFRYKFSWSPKGVVMAGNNDAQYLKDGKVVKLPTEDLFKNPLQIDFPEVGQMEVYPNRDSLQYIDIYELPDVQTMFRGTFRYPKWCASLDAIKAVKMITYKKQDFKGKTYAEITAGQIGGSPENIKKTVATSLNLDLDSPAIIAMEWLGLFDNKPAHLDEGSTFDITSDLMLEKMMLPKGARDMVIMLHSFLVENANGKKEVIKSRLLDFATKEDTSIARTVALPAAIGVKMILDGSIKDTGVHIPIAKSIYDPILDELEVLNIKMVEEYGLAEEEKLG